MNLTVALGLIFYWVVWILLLTLGPTEENLFLADGATLQGGDGFNSTGFTEEELDSGGFFSSIFNVFDAVTRFIILVLFGIGIMPTAPFAVQTAVSLLISGFTLFSIGFVIDAVWSG